MFEFVNRLWPSSLRKSGGAASGGLLDENKNLIRVLVITKDNNFFLNIHQIATGCGWETRLAETVERGLHILDEFQATVAIYDWPETEQDWRRDVDRLAARPDRPCILLASRVDDEYLGAELVRHGGFDVIPRCAPADKLTRNIQFAGFFRKNSQITRGGRPLPR